MFVDNGSVELFVDGGRIAMTNLVFPCLLYTSHTYHLQKRVGLITGVSLLIFFGTRFALEFMKNPQVAEEADMTFNIGQWLSCLLYTSG